MYVIFTYIYHKKQPNVGKYTSPMDGMGMFLSQNLYAMVFHCSSRHGFGNLT